MIEFEERDELEAYRNFNFTDARRLWRFVHPDRWRLAAAAVLTVTSSGITLLQPLVVKQTIDIAVRESRKELLLVFILAYLGLAAGNWIVGVAQTHVMGVVGQQTLYRMRVHLFSHLQELSMSFYDRTKVGRIISRMTSDIGAINELMTNGLINALASTLTLAGIVVLMLVLNWRLALLCFLMLPVLIAFLRWFTPRSRDAWRVVRDRTSGVNAAVAEGILGVRVIQGMAREERNNHLFDLVNTRNFQAGRKAGAISAALGPAVDVLTAASMAVVIGAGGYWILGGAAGLTVGLIAAFVLYMEQFFDPLRLLSELYDSFQNAATSSERIFALLNVQPEVRDAPKARDLSDLRGEVEFDHVTFEYAPGRPVIHDLCLRIEAGETVALVGATGSGKTTLASMVLRFYDVRDGAVRVDATDVRDVTQASLRRHIAIVLQDPFIFSGTLRDNITYGRPGATDAETVEAVRAANLAAFVEQQPFGLDSALAERGAGLSLGQRQLISFARAILADPKILVLDEATSNVDTETERLVQQALERLVAGRTAIVIAHRLSTVERADRIVVLDQGRIVEQGTHAQLIAARGFYYRLRRLGLHSTDDIARHLLGAGVEAPAASNPGPA